MKQEVYNNQSKIFGETTASKFQGQHAAKFKFYRYKGLYPATKTKIHRWSFPRNFAKFQNSYFLEYFWGADSEKKTDEHQGVQ